MAIIVDPDSLNQGSEVTINAATKKITLNLAGNLSTDGVTGQCLYSFLKEEWKSDSNLVKYPFPMQSITNEQFEFIEGWEPFNDATRKLIRTAGWAEVATGGAVKRQYSGIISLGTIGETDVAYYQQTSASSAVNFTYDGPVNEAVQIYGDGSNGNFDYRGYFKIFVRVQGKKYSLSTITAIGVSTMTYIVYRFPLANESDLKITNADGPISSAAPYTGITVTYYGSNQNISIGGASYPFRVIVEGNNATAEQIYEKVQYLLRQTSDIDSGAGSVTGKTADGLLTFVGDTLLTSQGVYIQNFDSNDTNRLQFTDQNSVVRTFPFVATLTLIFNDNLIADANSVYRVYFTNDDAGDNTGRDFGTSGAIMVLDASTSVLSGLVSGAASKTFTYAYDTNVQRGNASSGTAAPVTVVAIGLGTSQYVRATGTISRSTSNTVSLAAPLERNYSNT
jgi:hypothetical protein